MLFLTLKATFSGHYFEWLNCLINLHFLSLFLMNQSFLLFLAPFSGDFCSSFRLFVGKVWVWKLCSLRERLIVVFTLLRWSKKFHHVCDLHANNSFFLWSRLLLLLWYLLSWFAFSFWPLILLCVWACLKEIIFRAQNALVTLPFI